MVAQPWQSRMASPNKGSRYDPWYVKVAFGLFSRKAQRLPLRTMGRSGYLCLVKPSDSAKVAPPSTKNSVIRYQNSRRQSGWLWPIDQAGHLVPSRQQPIRSVEFDADPFGIPTIHRPFALPSRA